MAIVINNSSNNAYFGTVADGSITTAKIADGTVTPAKLSSSITSINPNYIINSDFKITQASSTPTTGATIIAGNSVPTASLGYPVLDCWFAYCLGTNATLSQVAQTAASSARLQLATLASSTDAGVGQRIESLNAINLASKTVTLSFSCSHTNLTLLTVTVSRPTTTADTFGTIGTSTKTQVATTNISINNSFNRYTWTFACTADVDKGLEILFTIGSNASAGTFQLANVRLEEGSSASTFIPTDYGQELAKCQRQYARMPATRYTFPSPSSGSYQYIQRYDFPETMRAIPVVSKTYSSTGNTSSFSTVDTTLDFFTDRITATTAGNAIWTLAAEYFAYIP